MNEEEVNKEIYSNLKYKLAPDEQDRAFEATLVQMREAHFTGKQRFSAPIDNEQQAAGRVVKMTGMKDYLKWATGIAAVLMVGLFIWAPWNANLYNEYTISSTFSVAERGDATADLLSRAAEQYNSKNYAAAKPLLEKVHATKPEDAMVAYYYAITLVETGEEDKGRLLFANLYDGESVFKYDAAFYTALSYVKQQQSEEALAWLDKVPSGTSRYELAQKLKGELQ